MTASGRGVIARSLAGAMGSCMPGAHKRKMLPARETGCGNRGVRGRPRKIFSRANEVPAVNRNAGTATLLGLACALMILYLTCGAYVADLVAVGGWVVGIVAFTSHGSFLRPSVAQDGVRFRVSE